VEQKYTFLLSNFAPLYPKVDKVKKNEIKKQTPN
jgi:hypothetical protein